MQSYDLLDELDSEDKFNVHIFDKEGNDKGISQLPI